MERIQIKQKEKGEEKSKRKNVEGIGKRKSSWKTHNLQAKETVSTDFKRKIGRFQDLLQRKETLLIFILLPKIPAGLSPCGPRARF